MAWRSAVGTTSDGFRGIARAVAIACVFAGLVSNEAIAQGMLPRTGTARADSARADSARAAAAEASPGSPRAAIEQFLSLARAGRYEDAGGYIGAGAATAAARATVARQLKAVLDRHLWVDLERVSPLPGGDTTDGLPADFEQIGTVRQSGGVAVPIRMQRASDDADVSWRFTRRTVAAVPALYAALDDRWMLEHVPEVLQRAGPFDILRWQWLALPLLLVAAALLGALVSRLVRGLFSRAVARTSTAWDDAILDRLSAPLTVALTVAAASALLPWLALYAPAEHAAYRIVRVALFAVFFWSLWRLVDVVRRVVAGSRWATASPASRALLPLATRITKVLVVALAVVAVLSMLGYPVTSLVAGLGLGGLALALAAQKTVENLFGAFSIGVDQPFREGDFVRIDDFVGTVEAIGLRSSRFRTLDRTLVTLPNGRVADMRIESYAARDRLRFAAVVGLAYETTVAQMREVLAGFERVLRDHPKLWPDAVVVRFREFAASSLDIEIMAWFQTVDWAEFQLIRQEILLQFMEVVERSGTSIAFPTRTVHLGAETVDALRALGATEPGARAQA